MLARVLIILIFLDGQYDVGFITQLVKNYRSHQDILKVPNKLFYDNKLKPQVNEFFIIVE